MRVLLDENLPHDLIGELDGLDVVTVQGLGWAGVKNGELLRRAAGTRKNTPDVRRTAAVTNLQRLARLPKAA